MTTFDENLDDFLPNEEDIKRQYSQAADEAWEEVEEQLRQNLVVAFLGTASSGKTSGIKALFDIDFGDIHPIPGSTKRVKAQQIDDNVYLIDAPGFGDIRDDVSAQAKKICDKVDLAIYVINAEGGYKQQEKEDYERLMADGIETLVVLNKIDLLRPHHKDEFIRDQRKKMGVDEANFIPVAFDPHPQISEEPINLDRVMEWIQNCLEKKGKDLLFAKNARQKDEICNKWIKTYAAEAFGIGAIPIPGSDYIPLTALQLRMITRTATLYGHHPSRSDSVSLITQVFTGQAGKQLFKAALTALKAGGWIPGPGWVVQVATSALAASIAASSTYGLGKVAQAYYRSDMKIPDVDLEDIFKKAYNQYRKSKPKGS